MNLKSHPALMALTTVVVIGAISVLIVVFIVLSGVDLLQLGLYDTKYNEVFLGNDGCAEEALTQLNSDSGFSGTSVVIGNVNCTITVTGAGSTRTINVASELDSSVYVNEIEIDVTISPKPLVITDWDEVVN